jgi:hypothetical protein
MSKIPLEVIESMSKSIVLKPSQSRSSSHSNLSQSRSGKNWDYNSSDSVKILGADRSGLSSSSIADITLTESATHPQSNKDLMNMASAHKLALLYDAQPSEDGVRQITETSKIKAQDSNPSGPLKPEINQEKEENSLLANSISSQEVKDAKNAQNLDGKIFGIRLFDVFFRIEFLVRICRPVGDLEKSGKYG